ncbi:MAG: hypothetical protein WBR56_20785 [Sedimenticolaceae bacterium]
MQTLVLPRAIVAAFLTVPIVATAGGGYTGGVVNASQDAWSKEALYDPCMNGGVSASGMFSSQLAEDKAMVRMGRVNASEP